VVAHIRPSVVVLRGAHTDEAWLTAQVPGSVYADLRARLGVRSSAETF